MGLDQISFLAADVDVSSDAFNRRPGLPQARTTTRSPARLLLSAAEVDEFAAIVEAAIRAHAATFAERRIAQDPAGPAPPGPLLPRAPGAGATFVAPPCNAPWASLFIEADGAVRPCFFHPAVGNLRERPLAELLSRRCRRFAPASTWRPIRSAPAASAR